MYPSGRCVFAIILTVTLTGTAAMARTIVPPGIPIQKTPADTARINDLLRQSQNLLRSDITGADSLATAAYRALQGSGYDEGLANYLILRSYISSAHGDDAAAFEHCRKAIGISERLRHQKLLSRGFNQLYLLHYQNGNYDSATIAAEKSLSIAQEIGFVAMLARGHQNFGILNSIRGNHAAAIEHFLKSEEYYTALKDDFALAMLLGNLGVTFEEAGNYGKAIEYMHRELSVSKKIKNENLQAWSMVNLGSVHSMTGSPDSAFHYYTLSLEIAEHIKDHDLMITVLDNIGSYYSEQKDYTRAKRFLNKAYALAEETGYQYQNVYTSGHLAENYFAEGKFDSALYYAHKQLELATAFDFPYDRKLAYATLSKTYAARKDYARAYDAMVRHTVINDSLFSKEKSMQLESLREHYEAEKKDHAITLLRQQRQSDAFRRNVYVTAGLSALSILLLLYYRQRKAGSENLRLLLKEQELEKTKSRFFANISHEFRTPLTLILGPVHMLDENVEDPRLKLQIGIMQQNAKRLLSLTNQLLDLARLEAGQLKLQVIHGDIIPVVKGITQAFSSLAETRGITLDMNISEQDLPLYFDKEKIETVLTNLLSNAFKFTPDGGKIALTLSLSDRDDHTCCRITVRDTGIGIAPEDVGNVFNRFYQSATTHQGQYGGTGIGLALTKELVDLHGGSVAISSDEGVGTEVTIWLPLGREHFKGDTIIMAVPEPDLVSDDDVEIEGALHQPAVVPEQHPLLLLIEDNPDVMHYLKSILADRYRILEAANGDNGIRAAIEHIPDLIVSDVMMPGKDGYEVCATLKKNEKTSHVPLILLTAKTAVEDKLHGLESMAEDYLTKPFHPKELLVRVQNLIASRKQLREKFNRQLVLKPSEIAVSSVDEVFLRRVIKAIEDNLENEHFSIEQLGKDVGMSRSQIHRKLHALTNQSATQFIRSFRLTRAMDMIRQHAGSVSEIAYSVGFSSPSYFNRCFLQHFGCTPGEVKRSGEAG